MFDLNDVIWAMTTRYQGDADTIFIPGVRCHPLDPSQDPAFSNSIRAHGITCKTIFDCTVPYDLKHNFQRSQFMEVDVSRFILVLTVNHSLPAGLRLIASAMLGLVQRRISMLDQVAGLIVMPVVAQPR